MYFRYLAIFKANDVSIVRSTSLVDIDFWQSDLIIGQVLPCGRSLFCN